MKTTDEKDFSRIFQIYYPKIYSYIYKHLGHKEDAEDMTNMVFLSCYQKFNEFDESKASITTWLYVIAGNRLKNYYRDKKQNVSMDSEEGLAFFEALSSEKDEVEQAVLMEETMSVLEQAVDSLSEKQKKIIRMRFYEDKSATEMAKILGTTSGNVRVLQNRALIKLRDILEQMDYLN